MKQRGLKMNWRLRYRKKIMTIIINIDVMLAKRKMKSIDLAKLIGINEQNLSILKTGKAKAIRLSTLAALCKALECTPGDILAYEAIVE